MALAAMLPMLMVPLHRAECLACGGAEVDEHRMNNVGQPQDGPLAGRLEWDGASEAQPEAQELLVSA